MQMDVLPLDIITLFPRITRFYINNNLMDHIPFEFHSMTQLVELRFDSDKMVSPSPEIWSFGLARAMEYMSKIHFARGAKAPRIDLSAWSLSYIPAEVMESSMVTKVRFGARVYILGPYLYISTIFMYWDHIYILGPYLRIRTIFTYWDHRFFYSGL